MIGTGLYADFPIQPALILNINFLMDTWAALMLGTELPEKNYKILGLTQQFNKATDKLMTWKMYFLMTSTTIY
jgi:magnesium-transporting ATPase (P-type)